MERKRQMIASAFLSPRFARDTKSNNSRNQILKHYSTLRGHLIGQSGSFGQWGGQWGGQGTVRGAMWDIRQAPELSR
jgi:hypothetical protein